jgi:hypothetical protein
MSFGPAQGSSSQAGSVVVLARAPGNVNSAVTLFTYTTGGADETLEAGATVLATTSTNYSFQVQLDWTDQSGVARTSAMPLYNYTPGSLGAAGQNLANANGPLFHLLNMTIRAQSGTQVVMKTIGGTFTNVTYDIDGWLKKLG